MSHAWPVLLVLLHGGDDRMDFVYFLSAVFMVLLPLAIFIVLTYWLIKAYWRSQRPPA